MEISHAAEVGRPGIHERSVSLPFTDAPSDPTLIELAREVLGRALSGDLKFPNRLFRKVVKRHVSLSVFGYTTLLRAHKGS
jgi:hypothetical protein